MFATSSSVFSRSLRPMDDAQLARIAPSVFAEEPWDGVSDKYAFVSTAAIVNRLRDEGFVPVTARQSRTRISGKRDYAKHELRFVQRELLESSAADRGLVVGGTYPLVALTNSHDTGSAFAIDAGMYRLICGNGMMVPDGIAQSVRVRHSGDLGDVIEGVYSVVDEMRELPHLVQEYSGVRVNEEAQRAFATAALELRDSALPLTPEQILRPRRYEERNGTRYDLPTADLWTTLNVVQENLTKGGIRSRTATGRRTSTRAVADISADQKLNKALFVLAEQMKAALQ